MPKEEMKKHGDYPAVVIGSGMGGLASAVYLSRAGFPVTVLEQHNLPGGYATAFQRGDFNFDVSLHRFGLGEDIYRELGLEGKVERVPINETRRVIREGMDVTVPDFSSREFIDFVREEGTLDFYEYCQASFDEAMIFGRDMISGTFSFASMPQKYPKMWELGEISFSDLLYRYMKKPEEKSSLAGVFTLFGLPPSQTSGFIAAVGVGNMMKDQFYYFKSRSQDLTNALVEIIKENKGTIVLDKTVNKIVTQDNKVTGVETEEGSRYPAKFVVSNANAPDTFGKFLSDNETAQQHMASLSKYKPSISSFIVWLGLRGELRGKIPGLRVTVSSEYDAETDFNNNLACSANKCPVMVTLYDNYYEGYSKPGTSTLTILIHSGYEPWRRFEKEYFAGNKGEYNREKERIAHILIKRVEENVIPGLSSMIQVVEAATPLTNIRFTKNPEGAIFGYPNSIDNAYMNRGTKNTTPIKGLFLSSGWGSRSGSYTGGIMNGREVSQLIIKNI